MGFRHFVVVAVVALLLGQGGSGQSLPTEFVSITGGNIELDKDYVTNIELRLLISRWKTTTESESFQVLVGPAPGSDEAVTFTIANTPFIETVFDPALGLELVEGSGFVYMAGIQPYGGTDGGSSTSEGTITLVQRKVEPNPDGEEGDTIVHRRFFRLHGAKKVFVRETPAGLPKEIRDNAWHIEIAPAGGLSDPKQLSTAAADIQSFVAQVIGRARKAGLPTPN